MTAWDQGQFISATEQYCQLYCHVNAPCLRRVFALEKFQTAELYICGLGFYEAYLNGVNITKGKLAPYIANPDHLLYFDHYDVTSYLRVGDNAFGAILGNGILNNMGAYPWGNDAASYRSAPKLSLTLLVDGEVALTSDTLFRCAPSPILFDDLRCGEYYDARLEQKGWNEPGFDDTSWSYALLADRPRGEAVLCKAEPVRCVQELMPIKKTVSDGRLLFDFGVNTTGVCQLKYKGAPGQRITLWHGETLVGGTFYNRNVYTPDFDGNLAQKDVLICSGDEDVFEPRFTIHGFRYVFVEGIYPYDVADDFLTFRVMSSDLAQSGWFSCSDETVNALQKITVNSDRSNFLYFPMDCPQREKNGWTADAALSAEQMLWNTDCANSLKVWLDSIRKAQRENGQLPGVVPTANFGYEWGNGPAWDQVIVELPYQIYRFTGDRSALTDNRDAIYRYVTYLKNKTNENGLLDFGLGDWCETGKFSEGDPSTPVEVTDTLVSIDLLRKSEFIFERTDAIKQADVCRRFREQITERFRALYVTGDLTVSCDTQTAQAKAVDAGIFTEAEKERAIEQLLSMIHRDGDRFKVGVIGARVLFRVLAENGYAPLAHRLITQDGFPSYKYWLNHGATSLWEGFHECEENSLLRKDGGRMLSLNHHFWGDISAWFYEYILGLRINPTGDDPDYFEVTPCRIPVIRYASGGYRSERGTIQVIWRRGKDGTVKIDVETTGSYHYRVKPGKDGREI